jgi:hypothetical protein
MKGQMALDRFLKCETNRYRAMGPMPLRPDTQLAEKVYPPAVEQFLMKKDGLLFLC